ncbi:SCO2523 family variant P-loop protein [Actinomadura nitritigenes]|uniref:SCO2523 family variant P-loop protein n=1 Tax=Actinomadura nitritigenes TaxID=134602 RepID=UPI003D8FEA02
MLVIATSDKGGTGRSVTGGNIAYRRSLLGSDVCYLDFDFGSPTAGAVFGVERAARGIECGGLHSFLQGRIAEPDRIDVWRDSDQEGMGARPPGAGRLVLLPGDRGGGEFALTRDALERCTKLLIRLQEEFDLCLIDLSAGRSHAAEMVLTATAQPELRPLETRWLVFHRWTRQNILAAAGLVYGDRGLIRGGVERGHREDELAGSIRFVRTAMLDFESAEPAGLRPAQAAWLREHHRALEELARRNRLDRTTVLAAVPFEPALQMREQLISDQDVRAGRIANAETPEAFDRLARKLTDPAAWERP